MPWVERYVRADAVGGGDGTADNSTDAWQLGEAITQVLPGHRVNVKVGTYDRTTTQDTLSVSGTTAESIWWSGFTSTAGDMDGVYNATKPVIQYTSGWFRVLATHNHFSNLAFTNDASDSGVELSQVTSFYRCRLETTRTNASSAIKVSAVDSKINECFISAPATATRALWVNTSRYLITNCAIVGGATGIGTVGNGAGGVVMNNVIRDAGTNGLVMANDYASVIGNTIYGSGSHGISLAGADTSAAIIANLISRNGGAGISGNTGRAHISRNAFDTNSGGDMNNTSEIPMFDNIDDVNPFVDRFSNDFSLLPTAGSVGTAMAVYEAETYTSYLDRGGVQIEATGGGGGGGLITHPGMTGGIRG